MQKAIDQDLYTKVQDGLEFMLGHFSQPWFPRTISTAATGNRQCVVHSKEEAMHEFEKSEWRDCRISAFGLYQKNPDVIFIDLDPSSFKIKTLRSLKLGLKAVLKNIADKLDGAHPTVDWSGNGYHILQPIDCPTALEEIPELKALDSDTSDSFLQFSERHLSMHKSDRSHHPAMRSCMIRVPNTFNSKCIEAGVKDPTVKILQSWDGNYRPDFLLLVGRFQADLILPLISAPKKMANKYFNYAQNRAQITKPFIDRILETPIADHRKDIMFWVIVPYLVTDRQIKDKSEIHRIVGQWLDKCNDLCRLQPSRRDFERRIDDCIKWTLDHKMSPTREENLVKMYPDLGR